MLKDDQADILHIPEATAAALPPELPPATLVGSEGSVAGLIVGPKWEYKFAELVKNKRSV